MKKSLLVAAAVAGRCRRRQAQANDTLAKIKDAGSGHDGRARIVRRRCPTPLGDGKYAGYHVEICQRVIADIQKAARRCQAGHQVPAGHLAEPHPAGAERHRRHRVRLHHQQRHAPEGRRVRRSPPTSTKCASRSRPTRASLDRPAQRQEGRHHHRHHLGAAAAQARARRRRQLQGSVRQGPRRQLPAARIRPRRRLRDGRQHPGRQHRQRQEPGRLQDRRRGAVGRADRHHDPQGRPGLQEGGRRQHQRP